MLPTATALLAQRPLLPPLSLALGVTKLWAQFVSRPLVLYSLAFAFQLNTLRKMSQTTRQSMLPGVLICLLFFFLASYVQQPHSQCPTPLSRLDLLHALVKGKLSIDEYSDNTPDKAEYKGHHYSDKAPGTVCLALPPFLVGAAALKGLKIPLDSDRGWLISSWIPCIGSITVTKDLCNTRFFESQSRTGPKRALTCSCS